MTCWTDWTLSGCNIQFGDFFSVISFCLQLLSCHFLFYFEVTFLVWLLHVSLPVCLIVCPALMCFTCAQPFLPPLCVKSVCFSFSFGSLSSWLCLLLSLPCPQMFPVHVPELFLCFAAWIFEFWIADILRARQPLNTWLQVCLLD